jgi:hypothetical protein
MSKNTIEKTITEEQLRQSSFLSMTVEKDSELKKYLVEYVGKKLNNENVTVDMLTEVLAVEFPEFVFSLAEENFLRGYQLGLEDAEKLYIRETETIVADTE